MPQSPNIEQLIAQIPDLSPKTIRTVVDVLSYYLELCSATTKKATIKDLSKDLPYVILGLYGRMSDIAMITSDLYSYSSFKKVLEKGVELGFYSYSEGDNINDLDLDQDLIFDVKAKLRNYEAYLEKRFTNDKDSNNPNK